MDENPLFSQENSFPRFHPDRKDFFLAALLFLLIGVPLLFDLAAPGVTWDEAFRNFPAAKKQAEWLRTFFSLPAPFSQATLDAYWQTPSDHPSLSRTIAAVSYLAFSPWLDEIIAFRIPSAVQFALLISTIYLFSRRFLPRVAALAGAVSLSLMPRVFGHAHLFSLDISIMAWWFWAAVAGFMVFHGWFKPWVFGVAYAVAFTTKLQAVFLPFPLLVWVLIQLIYCRQDRSRYRRRLLWAILWAAILTPILYIGLQPWLWHDPGTRIVERFSHYAAKTSTHPIRLYYLGKTFTNNTPWHYPFVMFAFTVPVWILVLIGNGIFGFHATQKNASKESQFGGWNEYGGVYPFSLLLFLTPMCLLLLPKAQGYDGCRLFLACFPFAAVLAGLGYDSGTLFLRRWLAVARGDQPIHWQIVPFLFHLTVWTLLLLPSLVSYWEIRPYYLAYYNEIAGGIAGARDKGMETTYWCDALTRDFLRIINQTVPPGKKLKPLSMAYEVIDYYKERGWLRPDIQHVADPPYDFHLLQFRQGMFTEAEWYLDKRRKPLAVVEIDKVPLFALYGTLE